MLHKKLCLYFTPVTFVPDCYIKNRYELNVSIVFYFV